MSRTGRFNAGNPEHEGLGTSHYFRAMAMPVSNRAPGLPEDWAGGDRGSTHDASNPVRPFSNSDPVFPIPYGIDSACTWKSPLTLHVDSVWRNTVAFPSPGSFRVLLPGSVKGVIGIELVQLNVPNVVAVVPPGRYFWVAFGTIGASGTFSGNVDFRGRCTMYDAGLNSDTGFGSTAEPSVAPYAIAKINYDATLPFQSWERGEMRFIHWCSPIRERITYIDLSLVRRDGLPYDIGGGESWSASFEIICKSS